MKQDKVHETVRSGGPLRRRVAILTVAAALAIPLAGIASQPAAASVRYAAVGDGLALRAGPGTQYPVLRRVNNGTPLDIGCQVQGGTNVHGNATWDKLVGGEWVADYYTTSPSFNSYAADLGDCNAPTGPSSLTANQYLQPGQALVSPNHRFWMIMQSDGNLVLYDGFGWRWSSATKPLGGRYATIGSDGNFVVKNASSAVIWQTGTRWPGTEGNGRLDVQNDGNAVIHDALGEWTWQSQTYGGRNTDPRGATRPPANNGLQVMLQGSGVMNVVLCGYNQYGGWICAANTRLQNSILYLGYVWKGYIYVYKYNANNQFIGVTKTYLPRYISVPPSGYFVVNI